ncbi:MAG: hypothetical protein NTY86_13385 [Deltaproteobacteria bacterium]|nr:hypothetical protein [Deltaproteobacteria bacterium]
MDKTEKLNVSARLDVVSSYHDEYLKELTSSSKIFITLSIAIIGFSLSFMGPGLRERIAINWIIWTWLFLWLTLLLGFLSLYLYPKIFKAKADYLHESLMFDIAERFEDTNEVREKFHKSGNDAYLKYEILRKWVRRLIIAQAVSLSLSLLCYSIFIYMNFIMRLCVT